MHGIAELVLSIDLNNNKKQQILIFHLCAQTVDLFCLFLLLLTITSLSENVGPVILRFNIMIRQT